MKTSVLGSVQFTMAIFPYQVFINKNENENEPFCHKLKQKTSLHKLYCSKNFFCFSLRQKGSFSHSFSVSWLGIRSIFFRWWGNEHLCFNCRTCGSSPQKSHGNVPMVLLDSVPYRFSRGRISCQELENPVHSNWSASNSSGWPVVVSIKAESVGITLHRSPSYLNFCIYCASIVQIWS